MEFDTYCLGLCSTATKIADYKIMYDEHLEGCPVEDSIRITFKNGSVLEVDYSYIEEVKEAKEKGLLINLEYDISIRNEKFK